jgi:putative NADH-flavin reductase
MSGTISRFKVISHTGGDTSPRYIWLGAAASLTVDDGIVIRDCDFLQGPSGQTEVFYNGTTENRDKVVLRSNAYRSSTALDFASAATLIVPDSDQTLNITGNTNVTAINALRNGAVLRMRFASTPTVTAGATLKLAGAANFVATADDVLVLTSDGTNFREVSRSANA